MEILDKSGVLVEEQQIVVEIGSRHVRVNEIHAEMTIPQWMDRLLRSEEVGSRLARRAALSVELRRHLPSNRDAILIPGRKGRSDKSLRAKKGGTAPRIPKSKGSVRRGVKQQKRSSSLVRTYGVFFLEGRGSGRTWLLVRDEDREYGLERVEWDARQASGSSDVIDLRDPDGPQLLEESDDGTTMGDSSDALETLTAEQRRVLGGTALDVRPLPPIPDQVLSFQIDSMAWREEIDAAVGNDPDLVV